MNALSRFVSGLLASPLWVKLWLLALGAVNMLVPLFYLARPEAQLVLATFVAGFALLVVLTARFGFTRILGLGHILWIPLVLWLVGRVDAYPVTETYGLWLRSVIVLNSISLVIDITDVVRYLRGERTEAA